MFKVIALSLAVAAIAGTASAQATSQSQAKVKTHSTMKRHKAKTETEESPAALQKEAKISEATARATALKEVAPGSTVKKFELERENGKLIYSYDINVPGKTGIDEVAVNAIDGSVVAHEHETPKKERAEARQEAKEKKAKK
ncbi:MAG TPA: PepSY domain-containing protein [Gemmatimonadaceae bacterium]|nr:PepSY domain-containing protein [Gemmatimonadaceae bacterium]